MRKMVNHEKSAKKSRQKTAKIILTKNDCDYNHHYKRPTKERGKTPG